MRLSSALSTHILKTFCDEDVSVRICLPWPYTATHPMLEVAWCSVPLCTPSLCPDRSSLPLPEEVIVVVSAGCLPVTLLPPEDAGRVDGTAIQNGPRHPC